jgi:hypothetical protein
MCKVLDRNKFETERSGVFAQGVLTAAKMFFVENPKGVEDQKSGDREAWQRRCEPVVSGGGDGRRGTWDALAGAQTGS